jgi:NAD-dependent deacetylase
MINDYKISSKTKFTILTGAGISAESGIKTFRDSDGLWENHHIEDVATPTGFVNNPELVWNFYKERYRNAQEAKPNAAHYALAQLESKMGKNLNIITQNVDNLHRRAGSFNVYEMHGRLDKCFCIKCKSAYLLKEIDITEIVPLCKKCGEILRPDIVWFGEIPYFLDVIEKLIFSCDIFLVIGTSGVVYPAAGFVLSAKLHGAITIGVNLDEPANSNHFDLFYSGKAGDLLPKLINEWFVS